MLTKIALLSCLVACSLAKPQLYADSVAAAVPAIVPAAVPAAVPATVPVAETIVTGNCKIEFEELQTQNCKTVIEPTCSQAEIVHEDITYEPLCKAVTSVHCTGVRLFKRDAEADPEPFYGYFPYASTYAYSAPAAAAAVATVKSPCHEVTSEHCVQHPIVVQTPDAKLNCHDVRKAVCTPEVKQIPKTICTPATSDLRTVSRGSAFVHPFAYSGLVF